MRSIDSLTRRLDKVLVCIPPKPEVWKFDCTLLTEREQEQFVTFMGSLPQQTDLKDLRECLVLVAMRFLQKNRIVKGGSKHSVQLNHLMPADLS
ncbi:MAG TPA: hypothetical protein VN207_05070 [Ktedonobacteraceae bacterium]|nr:hypothetical protein [Ktedonobacteraceae bacterium]